MYRQEIYHPQLERHRVVTGRDPLVVRSKAADQMARWNAQWEKQCEAELKRRERAAKKQHEEDCLLEAKLQTEEAEAELEMLEGILAHTLTIDDTIDWGTLRDRSEFGRPPVMDPVYKDNPPQPNSQEFAPQIGLVDRVLSNLRRKKEQAAKQAYSAAQERWSATVAHLERENLEIQANYLREAAAYQTEREAFCRERDRRNEAVDAQCARYVAKDPAAIEEYCDLVLSRSEYPSYFPKEWELAFNSSNGFLIIDYSLPAKEVMPTRKEVKYIKTRKEFKESTLLASRINTLYDSVLYQICIRTIHEVLEADAVEVIEAVVFNGIVTSLDASTGNKVTVCIMSLQVSKSQFLELNLANVEPRNCFKGLKGVSSSKLHGMAAVAPIIQLDKEDSRFVDAYSVADELDHSTNLAAMNWEDFEHLIREIFESEFASDGGEVKVTKASRDGGVDAIAFDPDPIRGGKIAIQAKRYTATVGVSAVRDLYGTVMNEGATKGILVTTSDYGPDAYSFAQDKPLTLLNGANLLHLLERHGRHARIDIAEARKELPSNQE